MARRDTIHFRKTVLSICRWTLAACSSDSSQRCALHGWLPWRSTHRMACKGSAVQPAFCAKERTSSLPLSTPPNLSSFSSLCAWMASVFKTEESSTTGFQERNMNFITPPSSSTSQKDYENEYPCLLFAEFSPECRMNTRADGLCRYHEIFIKN